MDLIVKKLDEECKKDEIFKLLINNNLTSSKYAINNDIWNFQYNLNPLKKSWNSILVNKNDNTIFGHIGLIPQTLRAFSSDWPSASISNGVIDSKVRNKLLPFKKSKTFAIIPLIDSCTEDAFKDKVDVSFVYSTIHPLIWRTLKFNEINVVRKTTIHSSISYLYDKYYSYFIDKYSSSFIQYFAKLYSFVLVSLNVIEQNFRAISSISSIIKRKKISFNKINKFDSEFNIFMDNFYKINSDIITCKRNKGFLNWRFSSNNFLKYIFRINNRIIGYVILEKNDENKLLKNYKVVDCVVENQYLIYLSSIFKSLVKNENLAITYVHYISCKYSHKLLKESSKQGYFFNINPFKFTDKKKVTPSNMYYKLNTNSMNEKNIALFDSSNWFITPISFNPSYNI